jgi:hypothetical protein
MNDILHQQTKKPVRGRTPLVAALVLGCLFGTVNPRGGTERHGPTDTNQFAMSPVPFGSATWQSSFDSSKVWAQA